MSETPRGLTFQHWAGDVTNGPFRVVLSIGKAELSVSDAEQVRDYLAFIGGVLEHRAWRAVAGAESRPQGADRFDEGWCAGYAAAGMGEPPTPQSEHPKEGGEP